MKKLIAALLVSCMVIAPMSVMAEETAVELKWEDITSQEGTEELIAAGEFVVFDEIACQMWVPSVMPAVELTEDDVKAGYIGYFSTAEEDGIAAVMYVDVKGMSLEDYKAELENTEGVSGVTDVVINGLQCVGYDIEEADTTCVAFTTEAGYVLEFSFYPASDEDFASVIAVMMSSIMPEETTEETTEGTTEAA